MRGATTYCNVISQEITNFNPRTPCGVRQYFLVCFHPKRGISIHAPHAGCDVLHLIADLMELQFQSTHPMRGATFESRGGGSRCMNFNPRTPCGVRLTQQVEGLGDAYFNPRTPCGVRREAKKSRYRRKEFQSTHPMRGATSGYSRTLSVGPISIHAPHAGCDKGKIIMKYMPMNISIHAPHAGCDVLTRWIGERRLLFQSTHPMRGATVW